MLEFAWHLGRVASHGKGAPAAQLLLSSEDGRWRKTEDLETPIPRSTEMIWDFGRREGKGRGL